MRDETGVMVSGDPIVAFHIAGAIGTQRLSRRWIPSEPAWARVLGLMAASPAPAMSPLPSCLLLIDRDIVVFLLFASRFFLGGSVPSEIHRRHLLKTDSPSESTLS
jgi:hypothetical protein